MATKRPFNTKSFVIGALRRASYRTPMRYQALQGAKVAYGRYRCAKCEEVKARKEVQVDHVVPVVLTTGWDSFDGYIERLFCEVTGLQTLCKPCHNEKSKTENGARRISKKKQNV